MYLSESTHQCLVFHLTVTCLVVVFLLTRKRLSTPLHTWSVRALLLFGVASLVASAWLVPRDLIQNLQAQYTEHRRLWVASSSLAEASVGGGTSHVCVHDIDYMTRTALPLWSLLLLWLIARYRNRLTKVTLGLSCQYVALRYNCNYARLVALCERFGYAFFPIAHLEQHLATLGHRPPRESDVAQYIAEFEEQESDRLHSEAHYATQIKEAEAAFALSQHPELVRRRTEATMTYEQYCTLKERSATAIILVPPPTQPVSSASQNDESSSSDTRIGDDTRSG